MQVCDPMLSHRLLDQHTHAVVNRLQNPQPPFGLPALPIVPHGFSNEAHLFPWLLPLHEGIADVTSRRRLLDEIDAATARDASETPQAPCVLMLADCEASSESLTQHLASRSIATLATGDLAMLRWHDPAVLVQLRWMLHLSSWASLFGPIRRLTVWWKGGWYSFDRPEDAACAWTRFDAKETRLLHRIGQINAVLKALGHQSRTTLIERSQAIDALLAVAADRHGLHRADDQVAFATHALTVHPRFDHHPRIRALLAEIRAQGAEEDPQTYSDATALLQFDDWQQIGAELRTLEESTP